ncbi:(Fe-S)-binding protein [Holophaga foetida]|uniref:(Fe-S)-binding protein n=1 Tax=Holophaga foetida TaxID=35839 RepID=UPI0002471CFE|nr:(Fe-S)-binding protein [Holophaga foetida]
MALQDFRPMQERCSNCLNCRWVPFDKLKSERFGENCPSIAYNNFMTYSARGRFQLGQTILDGDADYTETITELVHDCMACGSCDVTCKVCRYNLEPLEHNIELKVDAVEKGKTLPAQAGIMAALKQEQTMIPGSKKAQRLDWAKGIQVKDLFKDKAEVAFYPGCKYSYDPKLQKVAQAALKLLIDAGADVGIMGNADACCGGRALQMGFRAEFTERAEANIKAFNTAGVKVIVTPCSDCYHALKRQYAKLGLAIEVLHTVEYLERLIEEGKLTFTKSVNMTVTYHDPCHLGRLGEPFVPWDGTEKKIMNQVHTWSPKRPRYNGAYGIYDAPRNVLAAIPGLRLVEMDRIREYAWCCGAGGGCSQTLPEYSAWTASERITEANTTGAEAMVTACPWCEANFMGAVDEHGKSIQVFDIIELVQQAL